MRLSFYVCLMQSSFLMCELNHDLSIRFQLLKFTVFSLMLSRGLCSACMDREMREQRNDELW